MQALITNHLKTLVILGPIKIRTEHQLEKIGGFVRKFIDFFYPPFKPYFSEQFFRYGATGSMTLVFDWVLYFILYNFVLRQQMVDLGFVVVSSHIATLGLKFPIVLVTGFLMQKYVTFSVSEIRGRVQLVRYGIVFFINLAINYLGLKLLVEHVGFYPTISNMLVSVVTVIISYFSQKYFTFRISTSSSEKMD